MDTSGIYVKMCEGAKEVQELRKELIEYGDYYYNRISSDLLGDWRICEYGAIETEDYEHGIIWLPRQDQLQGMVTTKQFKNNPTDCIVELNYKIKINLQYYDLFTSMEQLWLAFVMDQKYQKHWVDNDWVEI